MNFRLLFIGLLWCVGMLSAQGQSVERAREWTLSQQFLSAHKSVIPFVMVNNLIVIPISVNEGEVSNFILDTGVGNTLLFGVPNENIAINESESVLIAGLGDGTPIRAFVSQNNAFALGRLRADSLDVLVLEEDIFNVSEHMGMNIHGLIGYDLLADFVTEINYQNRTLTFHDPDFFRKKAKSKFRFLRWKKIPLILVNKKPYLTATFQHGKSSQKIPLSLLIDSGMSGALSLFSQTNSNISLPQKRIRANVGLGLNGDIEGYLGRIALVEVAGIAFQNPIVAYPDSADVHNAFQVVERNGSIGAEILRRNKIIFNYRDSQMYMRASSATDEPFEYNVLGIDISTPTPNLPLYYVSYVRPDSPAHRGQILVGDRITRINGIATEKYDFNKMLLMLHDNSRSSIQLIIQRENDLLTIDLSLANELTVDE